MSLKHQLVFILLDRTGFLFELFPSLMLLCLKQWDFDLISCGSHCCFASPGIWFLFGLFLHMFCQRIYGSTI